MNLRRFLLIGTVLLGIGPLSFAQPPSPRDELLALVPSDAGFCLVVQQLRDQAESWQRSPWIKSLCASPLGKTLEKTPEIQSLARLEGALKRVNFSWANLRDDILGDAVVFAYWPAPPGKPDQEKGLVLVRARSAKLLKEFVDNVNQEQLKSKELKELTEKEYRGIKYQRRVDQSKNELFLLVDGNVFAGTSTESLLHKLIDQRTEDREQRTENRKIVKQVKRAATENAFAILWVNPRAFDSELKQRPQVQAFLEYWRPLEAIVLSLSGTDEIDVRLAIQARVDELPPASRKIFVDSAKPTELWQHFPPNAILSVAGRMDVGQLAQSVGNFLPPEDRKQALEKLRKTMEPALKLDLAKEVVPNIGPDWGASIFAAGDAKQFPHILAAVTVKPGEAKVDQALLGGINFFATLAVYSSPKPLAVKIVRQENVEVHYLEGDMVFPPGLQPAWALKESYLVFASSPQAMLHFRSQGSAPATTGPEWPFLKLSATELSKQLRAHRSQVIDFLAEKNNLPQAAVNQTLDSALGVLDLIDQVTVSQSSGDGQIIWTVHMKPRLP